MNQRLELRQGQGLVLTPQLQQSLKILQLSTTDLINLINEEIEKNPLLSKSDADEENEKREEVIGEEQTEEFEEKDKQDLTEINENKEISIDESEVDTSYENVWDEESGSKEQVIDDSYILNYATQTKTGFVDENSPTMESRFSDAKSLNEFIEEQINLTFYSPVERIIAINLLDFLDDSGYISADYISVAEKLSCSKEDVEDVLFVMQLFEPTGVFARNLSECLAAQLKEKDRLDPAMQKMLQNLELVAKNDIAHLAKVCGVDKEDIGLMLKELKSLNPKPGSDFEPEVTENIEPDIFLKKTKDGFAVELNGELLPKLLVNKKYYKEVSNRTTSKDEKKYLSDQMNNANWLVKTLNQRAETILKVSSEIVKRQKDFFEKGIMHLKALTLKDIAEIIEMHESTVSRVTNNKYIMTPKGLYELKYFFSSSVQSISGSEDEDVSSRTIKHIIKELIDNESKDETLSDDKLAEILTEKGIKVARRTVTKYREALKIPSSVQRKRKKQVE